MLRVGGFAEAAFELAAELAAELVGDGVGAAAVVIAAVGVESQAYRQR